MLWSVEGESMSGSRKYCHGREEDEERLLEYGKRIFPVINRGAESAATWPHVARQVQKYSCLAGRYSQNSRVKCRE